MNFGFLIRSDVPRKTPFPRSRIGAQTRAHAARYRHQTWLPVYDMTSEATFAGLPRELKNQILGRTDLLDLARLRVVSPSMRDAVDEMMEDRRDAALAAKLGRLTVLKNLLQRGKLKKVVVCESAAEGGHLETLKWARENDCPWDERTCAFAAKGGHLEVLKWARESGCPWDGLTCTVAAKGGHLEVLKWLRANDCPWSEYMQYTRYRDCLLYTSPSPRDRQKSRMPSSA